MSKQKISRAMPKLCDQIQSFSCKQRFCTLVNTEVLWSNTKFLIQTKVLHAGEHRSFVIKYKVSLGIETLLWANAKFLGQMQKFCKWTQCSLGDRSVYAKFLKGVQNVCNEQSFCVRMQQFCYWKQSFKNYIFFLYLNFPLISYFCHHHLPFEAA